MHGLHSMLALSSNHHYYSVVLLIIYKCPAATASHPYLISKYWSIHRLLAILHIDQQYPVIAFCSGLTVVCRSR